MLVSILVSGIICNFSSSTWLLLTKKVGDM